MEEKKKIEIPYEEFTELVLLKGRVSATLAYLKGKRHEPQGIMPGNWITRQSGTESD